MSVPTTVRAVMNPQFLRSAVPSIEPLESRIAPAIIFVGDHGRNDIEYTGNTAEEGNPFVQTSANASDPISAVIGSNENVFYIRLNPGDILNIFGNSVGGEGYAPFISGPIVNGEATGLKGTVIAVFNDLDDDNEVDANELVGLSLGKNVKVQVSGTVFGDVVANYDDVSDTIGGGSESDLLANPIAFFGAANVQGDIVAGGAIKGINLTGSVNQILTGSAANGLTYDFNGPAEDGGGVLTVVASKAGPNISKITVSDVTVIRAGDGGAGAAGGNINNVTLISDVNGWVIQGGNGGDGTKGGRGGSVTSVLANGLDANATDTSANDVIQVLGGNGGIGTAGGGKGGIVRNVAIGFEAGPTGGVQRSINPVIDSVLIAGGDGGGGRVGGAGGSLINTDVFASPTLSGNDLVLRGGAGGDSTGSGKSGGGGSVTDFELSNPGVSAEAQQSRMFVDAGDGGVAATGSAGGKGGSVEKGLFTGFSIGITGGTGSNGTNGGAGGLVRSILAQDGFFGVQPKNIAIDAGGGGTGLTGRGGKGGLIDGITVRNAELSQFAINQTGGAGDGGDSQRGPGGVGGGVSNFTVNDIDSSIPSQVTMSISAGDGGNGGNASGGKGGSVGGKNVFSGVNASLALTGGEGGAATGAGSGGAGGTVGSVSFGSSSSIDLTVVTATIAAGNGGLGVGNGKGGAGGTLSTLSIFTDGNIALTAGTGGSGGTNGASGKGGSISNGATVSSTGTVNVTAGSAGTDGSKAGAGGALSQLNVQGNEAISLKAGSGSHGGAGGSIKEIGVSDPTQLSGPNTGLEIIAGAGSANGGAGGSISGVDGFIADSGTTLIQAGGGGGGTTKAGAGGSVNTITLRGGGGLDAVVNIEAGSAGIATNAKTGAKGGNVTDVGIGLNPFDPVTNATDPGQVQDGTLIRHIAAGNGGDAGSGKGGVGGTVQNVRAYFDIGAMRDEVFGFNTMGGIFAGSGGTGSTVGASGSVIGISADSIAAILAGRLANGEEITQRNLAASVEGIVLNSTIAAMVDANGTYLNYDDAGIVGAVRNPEEVGVAYPAAGPHANTFDPGEYMDEGSGTFGIGDITNAQTHGFVAALKFAMSSKQTTSVRPEAVLTTNAENNNALEFIDLNNTNGQIVVL